LSRDYILEIAACLSQRFDGAHGGGGELSLCSSVLTVRPGEIPEADRSEGSKAGIRFAYNFMRNPWTPRTTPAGGGVMPTGRSLAVPRSDIVEIDRVISERHFDGKRALIGVVIGAAFAEFAGHSWGR
jgi:hypothetical protein